MNNVKKDWWLSFNVFGEVWGVPLRELARMSAGDSLPDGVPTKGEIESELRRFAERESEALRYALAQPWSRVKPYARKLRDHIVVGNAEVGAAWALMRGAQVCVFEREDSTARVVCSQCGGEYPHASPIAQGYSHCEDHQVTA